MLRHLLIEPIK